MNLEVMENPLCAFCPGANVIRHGKTTGGNIRLRCRDCSKTWVPENLGRQKPDMVELAKAYLEGATVRELVPLHKTSPLRLNQKIRKFLTGLSDWESFADKCADSRNSQVAHLLSRPFSCKAEGSVDNQMHLLMVVDGLSSMVLGYEISGTEDAAAWTRLLARLQQRKMSIFSFLTNGSAQRDEAIKATYPESIIRFGFHKMRREKEIGCCLALLPVKTRLVNDAVRFYNTLDNQSLDSYLKSYCGTDMSQCLRSNAEEFVQCLDSKCGEGANTRVNSFEEEFRIRFEKFHMLKSDPKPVINGWIALQMLAPLEFGFNRLSLFKQTPCTCSFDNFVNNERPCLMKLEKNSEELRSFVNEIGIRVLQLPLNVRNCEINLTD